MHASKPTNSSLSDADLTQFIYRVSAEGARLYRDFPWRRTRDPYAVLVSEVMLQQTQTTRVLRYWEQWMERFPTIDALASASVADVLEAWQGLGYNRRALALKRSAEIVSAQGGRLPCDLTALQALPGIGPATAAGVMAFAYNKPAPYLETNVRAVFLHELFPDVDKVSDREVMALVERCALMAPGLGLDARSWNYTLLDYGVELKRALPNPSRRSKHHTQQSAFEGSHRQKRSTLLAMILADPGRSIDQLAESCGYPAGLCAEVLEELAAEGFIASTDDGCWQIAP